MNCIHDMIQTLPSPYTLRHSKRSPNSPCRKRSPYNGPDAPTFRAVSGQRSKSRSQRLIGPRFEIWMGIQLLWQLKKWENSEILASETSLNSDSCRGGKRHLSPPEIADSQLTLGRRNRHTTQTPSLTQFYVFSTNRKIKNLKRKLR